MTLQAGIVGLPNVGKSTLFNAITKAGAEAANYPFCTIDPNVGVVEVPDRRLEGLATIVHPEKIVPTSFEFVDIAGLVKGASKGEGLGNQFLAHIREVDAIIHVVRCFEDDDITHVSGKVDPLEDIATIDIELMFADMDTISKRLDRTRKQLKSGEAKYKEEVDVLIKADNALAEGIPLRKINWTKEELGFLKLLNLLTVKPVLYAANVSENDVAKTSLPLVQRVKEVAEIENAEVITISAKVESEIAELDDNDKDEFLKEIGLQESGLDRLIAASYRLLGLITYFTAGPKEVKAWTIRQGTKAPGAAGVIHSDFEKGFIRAEVIAYEDYIAAGSTLAVKEAGKLRLEGKEYEVRDGDVMHFRFNV
jgi:GTP-binding protein YchF